MIDPDATARRAELLQAARRWIGTPFRHQAMTLGAGCDCLGLVRAVGEACGVLEVDRAMAAAMAGYARQPHPVRMRQALEAHLVPIEEGARLPGDIAWLAWRADLPMHLAILGEGAAGPTLIHALASVGRVVEHGFTAEWPDRVDSWWRYRGLVPEAG